MREALAHEPVLDFPVFAELTEVQICSKSGLLPSYDCMQTMNEIFSPDTVPQATCDMCQGVSFDYNLSKKGPRENISSKQKDSIIKNFKKDDNESIINNLGDDLLE